MPVFSDSERQLAQAMIDLSHCNPFEQERVEAEQRILGARCIDSDRTWSWRSDDSGGRENIALIQDMTRPLLGGMRDKVLANPDLDDADRILYRDTVLYTIYHRYDSYFENLAKQSESGIASALDVTFYDELCAEARYFLDLPSIRFPTLDRMPHLVALGFQIKRAFHFIFRSFIGNSAAAARLRAAVWQSVVTHDTRRYSRGLYERMANIPTLICGPSGTGKELVARAIGFSRYIPFDPRRSCFEQDFMESFYPISLSALASSVIESELFGHAKGAYTGAASDRLGFFEVAGPCGTVFLDEIGDVSAEIQVKLLRVLQTRSFQRLGDTKLRRFDGKIVAATNADLSEQMKEGTFREDLYYRLCADKIVTPSLHEQIVDEPRELRDLLLFISRQVVGEEMAVSLADDVGKWIHEELPADYAWPGNIRELEQCVRNVLVRNEYLPASYSGNRADPDLALAVQNRSLKLNELIQWYCTTVYAESDGYEDGARKLGIDPRTFKSKIDTDLLAQLRDA